MSKMTESIAAANKMGIPTPTYGFGNEQAIAMLERKLAALKADRRRSLCLTTGAVDVGTERERMSIWLFTYIPPAQRQAADATSEGDDGEDSSWVCPPNLLPGCTQCPPNC